MEPDFLSRLPFLPVFTAGNYYLTDTVQDFLRHAHHERSKPPTRVRGRTWSGRKHRYRDGERYGKRGRFSPDPLLDRKNAYMRSTFPANIVVPDVPASPRVQSSKERMRPCPVCPSGRLPRHVTLEGVDLMPYVQIFNSLPLHNRTCPLCQSYVSPLAISQARLRDPRSKERSPSRSPRQHRALSQDAEREGGREVKKQLSRIKLRDFLVLEGIRRSTGNTGTVSPAKVTDTNREDTEVKAAGTEGEGLQVNATEVKDGDGVVEVTDDVTGQTRPPGPLPGRVKKFVGPPSLAPAGPLRRKPGEERAEGVIDFFKKWTLPRSPTKRKRWKSRHFTPQRRSGSGKLVLRNRPVKSDSQDNDHHPKSIQLPSPTLSTVFSASSASQMHDTSQQQAAPTASTEQPSQAGSAAGAVRDSFEHGSSHHLLRLPSQEMPRTRTTMSSDRLRSREKAGRKEDGRQDDAGRMRRDLMVHYIRLSLGLPSLFPSQFGAFSPSTTRQATMHIRGAPTSSGLEERTLSHHSKATSSASLPAHLQGLRTDRRYKRMADTLRQPTSRQALPVVRLNEALKRDCQVGKALDLGAKGSSGLKKANESVKVREGQQRVSSSTASSQSSSLSSSGWSSPWKRLSVVRNVCSAFGLKGTSFEILLREAAEEEERKKAAEEDKRESRRQQAGPGKQGSSTSGLQKSSPPQAALPRPLTVSELKLRVAAVKFEQEGDITSEISGSKLTLAAKDSRQEYVAKTTPRPSRGQRGTPSGGKEREETPESGEEFERKISSRLPQTVNIKLDMTSAARESQLGGVEESSIIPFRGQTRTQSRGVERGREDIPKSDEGFRGPNQILFRETSITRQGEDPERLTIDLRTRGEEQRRQRFLESNLADEADIEGKREVQYQQRTESQERGVMGPRQTLLQGAGIKREGEGLTMGLSTRQEQHQRFLEGNLGVATDIEGKQEVEYQQGIESQERGVMGPQQTLLRGAGIKRGEDFSMGLSTRQDERQRFLESNLPDAAGIEGNREVQYQQGRESQERGVMGPQQTLLRGAGIKREGEELSMGLSTRQDEQRQRFLEGNLGVAADIEGKREVEYQQWTESQERGVMGPQQTLLRGAGIKRGEELSMGLSTRQGEQRQRFLESNFADAAGIEGKRKVQYQQWTESQERGVMGPQQTLLRGADIKRGEDFSMGLSTRQDERQRFLESNLADAAGIEGRREVQYQQWTESQERGVMGPQQTLLRGAGIQQEGEKISMGLSTRQDEQRQSFLEGNLGVAADIEGKREVQYQQLTESQERGVMGPQQTLLRGAGIKRGEELSMGLSTRQDEQRQRFLESNLADAAGIEGRREVQYQQWTESHERDVMGPQQMVIRGASIKPEGEGLTMGLSTRQEEQHRVFLESSPADAAGIEGKREVQYQQGREIHDRDVMEPPQMLVRGASIKREGEGLSMGLSTRQEEQRQRFIDSSLAIAADIEGKREVEYQQWTESQERDVMGPQQMVVRGASIKPEGEGLTMGLSTRQEERQRFIGSNLSVAADIEGKREVQYQQWRESYGRFFMEPQQMILRGASIKREGEGLSMGLSTRQDERQRFLESNLGDAADIEGSREVQYQQGREIHDRGVMGPQQMLLRGASIKREGEGLSMGLSTRQEEQRQRFIGSNLSVAADIEGIREVQYQQGRESLGRFFIEPQQMPLRGASIKREGEELSVGLSTRQEEQRQRFFESNLTIAADIEGEREVQYQQWRESQERGIMGPQQTLLWGASINREGEELTMGLRTRQDEQRQRFLESNLAYAADIEGKREVEYDPGRESHGTEFYPRTQIPVSDRTSSLVQRYPATEELAYLQAGTSSPWIETRPSFYMSGQGVTVAYPRDVQNSSVDSEGTFSLSGPPPGRGVSADFQRGTSSGEETEVRPQALERTAPGVAAVAGSHAADDADARNLESLTRRVGADSQRGTSYREETKVPPQPPEYAARTATTAAVIATRSAVDDALKMSIGHPSRTSEAEERLPHGTVRTALRSSSVRKPGRDSAISLATAERKMKLEEASAMAAAARLSGLPYGQDTVRSGTHELTPGLPHGYHQHRESHLPLRKSMTRPDWRNAVGSVSTALAVQRKWRVGQEDSMSFGSGMAAEGGLVITATHVTMHEKPGTDVASDEGSQGEQSRRHTTTVRKIGERTSETPVVQHKQVGDKTVTMARRVESKSKSMHVGQSRDKVAGRQGELPPRSQTVRKVVEKRLMVDTAVKQLKKGMKSKAGSKAELRTSQKSKKGQSTVSVAKSSEKGIKAGQTKTPQSQGDKDKLAKVRPSSFDTADNVMMEWLRDEHQWDKVPEGWKEFQRDFGKELATKQKEGNFYAWEDEVNAIQALLKPKGRQEQSGSLNTQARENEAWLCGADYLLFSSGRRKAISLGQGMRDSSEGEWPSGKRTVDGQGERDSIEGKRDSKRGMPGAQGRTASIEGGWSIRKEISVAQGERGSTEGEHYSKKGISFTEEERVSIEGERYSKKGIPGGQEKTDSMKDERSVRKGISFTQREIDSTEGEPYAKKGTPGQGKTASIKGEPYGKKGILGLGKTASIEGKRYGKRGMPIGQTKTRSMEGEWDDWCSSVPFLAARREEWPRRKKLRKSMSLPIRLYGKTPETLNVGRSPSLTHLPESSLLYSLLYRPIPEFIPKRTGGKEKAQERSSKSGKQRGSKVRRPRTSWHDVVMTRNVRTAALKVQGSLEEAERKGSPLQQTESLHGIQHCDPDIRPMLPEASMSCSALPDGALETKWLSQFFAGSLQGSESLKMQHKIRNVLLQQKMHGPMLYRVLAERSTDSFRPYLFRFFDVDMVSDLNEDWEWYHGAHSGTWSLKSRYEDILPLDSFESIKQNIHVLRKRGRGSQISVQQTESRQTLKERRTKKDHWRGHELDDLKSFRHLVHGSGMPEEALQGQQETTMASRFQRESDQLEERHHHLVSEGVPEKSEVVDTSSGFGPEIPEGDQSLIDSMKKRGSASSPSQGDQVSATRREGSASSFHQKDQVFVTKGEGSASSLKQKDRAPLTSRKGSASSLGQNDQASITRTKGSASSLGQNDQASITRTKGSASSALQEDQVSTLSTESYGYETASSTSDDWYLDVDSKNSEIIKYVPAKYKDKPHIERTKAGYAYDDWQSLGTPSIQSADEVQGRGEVEDIGPTTPVDEVSIARKEPRKPFLPPKKKKRWGGLEAEDSCSCSSSSSSSASLASVASVGDVASSIGSRVATVSSLGEEKPSKRLAEALHFLDRLKPLPPMPGFLIKTPCRKESTVSMLKKRVREVRKERQQRELTHGRPPRKSRYLQKLEFPYYYMRGEQVPIDPEAEDAPVAPAKKPIRRSRRTLVKKMSSADAVQTEPTGQEDNQTSANKIGFLTAPPLPENLQADNKSEAGSMRKSRKRSRSKTDAIRLSVLLMKRRSTDAGKDPDTVATKETGLLTAASRTASVLPVDLSEPTVDQVDDTSNSACLVDSARCLAYWNDNARHSPLGYSSSNEACITYTKAVRPLQDILSVRTRTLKRTPKTARGSTLQGQPSAQKRTTSKCGEAASSSRKQSFSAAAAGNPWPKAALASVCAASAPGSSGVKVEMTRKTRRPTKRLQDQDLPQIAPKTQHQRRSAKLGSKEGKAECADGKDRSRIKCPPLRRKVKAEEEKEPSERSLSPISQWLDWKRKNRRERYSYVVSPLTEETPIYP